MITEIKNLLGITDIAELSLVITIFTFIAGYLLNRVYDHWKEIRRLKDINEYIMFSVKRIYKPLKSQIAHVEDLINQLKEEKSRDYIFAYHDNLNTNLFDDIKNYDFYKAFIYRRFFQFHCFTKRYIKIYSSLSRTIREIKSTHESNHRIFNEFVSKYINSNEELRLHTGKIEELYWAFRNENKRISIKQDQFLVEFDKIMHKIGSEQITDSYEREKLMMQPLINLYRDFEGDERSLLIFDYAKKCGYALKDIDKTRGIYLNLFNKQLITLKNCEKILLFLTRAKCLNS